jgi:hypothetical protein
MVGSYFGVQDQSRMTVDGGTLEPHVGKMQV